MNTTLKRGGLGRFRFLAAALLLIFPRVFVDMADTGCRVESGEATYC